MRKFLLFVALVILTLSPGLILAQNITPATPLQLCPNNNYVDLDTIEIIESAFTDFTAGESGVTYSLLLPAGFQFEPFTGNLFLSDSFTSSSFTVFPDSALITYSINAGSATGIDSIIITGLRVRTSTASLASADIDRGGTASHASNPPGANSHGSLSSGQVLTGITVSATDITCNGDGDGQLAVTVTSGNPPYDYSINFGSTYPYSATPITSLSAGGYIVTVRDNDGCVANSANVGIINEPLVITEVSVIKTDISCNGGSDGTITASATGGTGAINYSTNGIAGPYSNLSGSTLTGLGNGPIDVYFEDANGCQVDGTDVTINEPAVIVPAASTKSDISCNGLTDGSLTANASGGSGTINYSINGIGGPYNTEVGNPVNNLANAAYDIYFQDANGCQVDGIDITINEPSLIVQTSALKTNVVCNGNTDGTISAAASGGTGAITYSVSGFGGPYSSPSGGTTTGLDTGAYSIYFQDANGCRVAGSSLSITEPSALSELSVTKSDITCNNANDGSITALATGGTSPISFSVSGSGGPYSFSNGATAGSLTGGVKDVFFRDANGCTLDGTDQNIINPSVISISVPTSQDPTLVGGFNGFINFGAVSGGTGAYNYSIDNGSNYQTSPNFNNLNAGNYTLVVRDANLCTSVYGVVALNDPGNITGGQIEFFNNRFDTTICNGNITPLTIFSDTVEPVRDSLRWEISTNGVSWSKIMVSGTSPTYIINGPHATGRFYRRQTYQGGDIATSNIVQRKINNGNTILITVPQPVICIEDGNQTISANPAPISPAVGVLSLTLGSGLTDNTNGTANFDPSTSGAGTFTIDYNYTNEFGCISSNTANITVNENTSVSFVDQTNFLTTDPAFTLTGGAPASGTYDGPGVFGNQFFPGLTNAGTFNLTYTQTDVNGCSDSDTLTVTVDNPSFGSIDSAKSQYCSDEPLDIIYGSPPSGGTAINFVPIAGVLTPIDSVTAVINPNALAGIYTLVFEYEIGASIQNVTTDIRIDPAPVATLITNGSPIFCENDVSRSLSGAGTTPNPVTQTFLGNGIINDDGNGNAIFNAGNAGSLASPHLISFIYEDDNGCNDTATASLVVNPLPEVSFVITEPFSGDTLSDMKFCRNEDSLVLKSNYSSGLYFSSNNVAIDNSLGAGQAYFRPRSTSVGLNRNISYTYQDANSCSDTFEMNVAVNLLPNNFDYQSTPTGEFDPNPNIINIFCTDSNSVLLSAFFSGFGKNGIGFFKMDPPGNGIGGIDTTAFSNPDSVYFTPDLQSGVDYDVRYIYTDTSTGCTDSIGRTVRIESEPSLGVQLLNYPGLPLLNNSNNDTIDICINGNPITFQGLNDSIPGLDKTVPFSQSEFLDTTDSRSTYSVAGPTGSSYVFNPDSTDITGLHVLQFVYTSSIGCQNTFTFSLNVLDTPAIEILIDSNVVAFDSVMPQLCQSVDTLIFNAFNNDPGFGTMWISKQNPISPELDSDTLRDGANDTTLIAYPSLMLNYNQSRVYFANYLYTDTTTSQNCKNQIQLPFRINPLPEEQFTSQNPSLEYCNYELPDTLMNLGSVAFLDSIYFVGPGFSKIDSFTFTLDPSVINPDTTDQGTTIDFWYVFRDKNLCVDSTQSSYVVHPTPQINFEVKEQGIVTDKFCKSNTLPIQVESSQLVGNLLGNYVYRFDKLSTPQSQPNFQPIALFVGRDSLRVTFTSAAGCVDEETQAIYIYEDPISQFNVNDFCITDPIQFFDISVLNTDSTNLPDSINSWSWQFTQFNGDTVQNPIFNFSQQGFYNVELTVSNTVGCSDDTDSTFFFGEPPVANFDIDDFCAGQNILFENKSSNDTAVAQSDFKWSISEFPFDQTNLIATIVSDTNFTFQFNSPGAYSVRFDLSTSYGCADTITKRLDIRPVIDLSNGAVYTSNFNTDTIEWRPASLTDPNVTRTDFSWEQAIPNGTRINQGPNGPNEHVWVTNATGRYINKEQSFVEGPCFDFSRVQRPMIVFDYFSDLAVNDGVVLQYSKNKGQNWRTVGLEETGLEWYNERSVAGNPGNQLLDQVGWSITESGWKEARHQLDTLRNSPPMGSNNPFVRLRFAIGSSNNGQGIGLREGFAFSNIEIRERDKLTLIEHFTNITDANAREGDARHNLLLNTDRNKYDILDIQYHTDFPNPDPVNLDNSLEQGARSLFYGVSTIPRTVFEGNKFNNVTGTWVSPANFLDDDKHRFVAQRILEDAKFDIDLNVTKTNSDLNGTVTFTAKEDLIPGREYTAFIAVVEKFIPVSVFQGGAIQIPPGVEFRSVFKKFLPQASGTNISNVSNAGQSRLVNFNWNYNNTVYNPDSIYIVAFIQDNITREIYQVATDDTTNIWVPNSIDNSAIVKNQAEFKLYPNPSNGSSILQFYSPAEGVELMTIYDQMGHTILEEEIISGTKNVLLNLWEYPAGVYIVQIAHPKYGLKKSKLVITK